MSEQALAWSPSFTDRVQELLERIDYRLAETGEDKEAIFRLRYDAYRREGFVPANPANRVTDRFDETDNVWIFGLHIDGKLASSIRIHAVSRQHPISPCADGFADLLVPEIELGKTIIDPTRFVVDSESSQRYPELPYATVRLGYVAGEYFDAEIGVAGVRDEHKAFYRRLFGLRPACEVRPFPGMVKPVCLMMIHYDSVRAQITSRYPFMRSTYFERRMLFERRLPAPARPEELPTARVLRAANDATLVAG